jgi:hypothetical protein
MTTGEESICTMTTGWESIGTTTASKTGGKMSEMSAGAAGRCDKNLCKISAPSRVSVEALSSNPSKPFISLSLLEVEKQSSRTYARTTSQKEP